MTPERAGSDVREGAGELPEHPFRDSALLHICLGAVVLGIAWLTGGDLTRAVVVAALYVLVATAWSWYRFRQRLGRRARLGTGSGVRR